MMKKVVCFGVGVVLLSALLVGLHFFLGAERGAIQVSSSASEPASRVMISICGQQLDFENLEPGQSRAGTYIIKADDHYIVDVIFKSGRTMHKEVGYVTNGLDVQDHILIHENDVTLERVQAGSKTR